jgi:ATP-dependent RNA circularization protein (DNA/RNA ligase family)
MSDFFRFPHTAHIVWLNSGSPRDDKILNPVEIKELLNGPVVIEEKLDGANLGLSLGTDDKLRAQNRGQYLLEPYTGQFARLPAWLTQHDASLRSVLTPDLILFGEWCAAQHSLDYHALPDYFLLFDVYDRSTQKFWSTARRNSLAEQAGIRTVPCLHRGDTTVNTLKDMVAHKPSLFRKGPLEGVVVRRENEQWSEARGKVVRAEFTQAIHEHWSRKAINWNRVGYSPEK